MEPEHVAYGMRASYGLSHVTPDLIVAWERGTATPAGPELTALAGVLWCSVGELIGAPRTLREFRMARGLPAEDVARAVGVDLPVYEHMEGTGHWRGTERQSAALAELLNLSLPEFVTVSGRDGQLAELLHGAVTTRWQGYVRPTAKLLSLERRVVEDALRALHTAYQGRMTASLSWAGGTAATDAGDAGRDFLDRVLDHFWSEVERGTY
jgi:hypothetical protein